MAESALSPPWSLRAARHALGLTQGQLALRLGVGLSTVARWERQRCTDALVRFALEGLAAALWREHIARVAQLVRHGARVQHSVNMRRGRPFGATAVERIALETEVQCEPSLAETS